MALRNPHTLAYRKIANTKKNRSRSMVYSTFKDLSERNYQRNGEVSLDADFVVLINRSLVSKDTNIKDLNNYCVEQHKRMNVRRHITSLSLAEKEILGEFIDKMLMVSKATATQVINLQLLLTIFPKKLDLDKMKKIDLYNFYII